MSDKPKVLIPVPYAPKPKVWILTRSDNDGQARLPGFICWWPQKPCPAQLDGVVPDSVIPCLLRNGDTERFGGYWTWYLEQKEAGDYD